jgi:hypothetical protein
MPEALRAVVAQAAHDVGPDLRATVVGGIGRFKTMTPEDRLRTVHRIWPGISENDARQAVDMFLDLPLLEIERVVRGLNEEELMRTKQAIEQAQRNPPEK